jgi:hypothetical protein
MTIVAGSIMLEVCLRLFVLAAIFSDLNFAVNKRAACLLLAR